MEDWLGRRLLTLGDFGHGGDVVPSGARQRRGVGAVLVVGGSAAVLTSGTLMSVVVRRLPDR